jgi:nitroreductase
MQIYRREVAGGFFRRNAMDFFEVIKNRQSIRSYDANRPVERKILDAILDAGRIAPSAANRQPWRFIVVSKEPILSAVRACYARDWYKEAPHVLAVVGDKKIAWVRAGDGYCSIETDCTIAMDHLILAASALGVATCWIAAFEPDALRSALKLQPHEQVFAITPLGYPKQGFVKKSEKTRKPLGEIAQYL